ncbi:uncharacterized [Tachysurus ichikawai]
MSEQDGERVSKEKMCFHSRRCHAVGLGCHPLHAHVCQPRASSLSPHPADAPPSSLADRHHGANAHSPACVRRGWQGQIQRGTGTHSNAKYSANSHYSYRETHPRYFPALTPPQALEYSVSHYPVSV